MQHNIVSSATPLTVCSLLAPMFSTLRLISAAKRAISETASGSNVTSTPASQMFNEVAGNEI